MVLELVSVSRVDIDVIVQVNGHDGSFKAIIVDDSIGSVTEPFP